MPHHSRRNNMFGPYALLQTLGEGEFAKVKLGVHSETREEVAIKLIRRQSVDNTPRINKIGREISVLRTIRHPNIISLFDVIETERYIGIVIEYASGGELFDHILAHRYLKERDACRLFAQLMSGVHYLHSKHIVHRDLKLENLLLDRNRNIMITDFGFANQFDGSTRDLMSTSCGSPCYAAPELVISDGLYVGSGVDIWSCGVILYAMLAGYLPFDDDPSNPDGDNINQLYNYILATTLVFPDYISPDARDLLRMMLVPDPALRCDMRRIMSHRWLRPFAPMFQYTIEELEGQAIARLNGTTWIPPKQRVTPNAKPTPALVPKTGPPRPSADEVMPRRHTIWIDSVPDSAPSWETGRHVRHEADAMVPAVDAPSMTVQEEEEETTEEVAPAIVPDAVQSLPEEVPTQTKEGAESVPEVVMTDFDMERDESSSDIHLVSVSVPSSGSPTSTMGNNDDHIMGQGLSLSPPSTPMVMSPVLEQAMLVTVDMAVVPEVERPRTPDQPMAQVKTRRSQENPADSSPSTVSRRTAQHARIRPTTIHGEPMTHNFSYPTPSYMEPPVPSLQARQSTRRAPPKEIPPLPVYNQAQFQQSSPSLLQGTQKAAEQVPDVPPLPKRRESLESSPAFHLPPPPIPASTPHERTHRKGPSTSGKIFGFLGGLSKKHGDSASAKSAQETKTLQAAAEPLLATSPEPVSPSPVPSPSPPKTSPTKGKRRKTLSLLGGASEHQHHQIFNSSRPPLPSTEARIQSSASMPPGSTPTQRFMGWLRRKSFAKNSSERPVLPQMDLPRQGLSPSPTLLPSQPTSAADPTRRQESGTPPRGNSTHGTLLPSVMTMRIRPSKEVMPVAAPAVSEVDSKLKWHSGAVEMSALSSRHPVDIMFDIKKVILSLGMEFRVDTDFKVKCVRRRRKNLSGVPEKTTLYTVTVPDDNVSVLSSNFSLDKEAWTSAKGAGGSSAGGKKKNSIRTLLWRSSTSLSLPGSTPPVPVFPTSPRHLPQVMNGSTTGLSLSPPPLATAPAAGSSSREIDSDHGVWVGQPPVMGQNEGASPSLASSTTFAATFGGAMVHTSTGPEPLFGEDSIDSGEEVRFSIELCRIKNLIGIYCVDIRRMKGNLWAYKFLYHAVLNSLDLGSKGYIPMLPESENNSAVAK